MNHLTNIDLETQVLGTLLRAGEVKGNRNIVFQTEAHLRTSEVFSTTGSAIRRLTFEAICAIAREGAPASRHTVTNLLRRQGVPNVDFVETAASGTNLADPDAYRMALDALVELHQARKVTALFEDGRRMIEQGESSGDIAKRISRDLLQATDRVDTESGNFGDMARLYEASMRDLTERPESLWWMRWGIESVDLLLGAQIRGGQFVGIGAHTSAGKSVTMVDLIRANGVHGDLHPIGLSLEMKSLDIFDRLLSAVSSVPYDQIRDRRITPAMFDRYAQAFEMLKEKRPNRGWIEHMPWAHIHEIEAKIRNLHATHGSRVIIVDYVQLIRTPRNHSRELEVTEAVRTLKMLADELDIAIVGLYQLNDDMFGKSGRDRRPRSNQARESKNLDKDADVSMVIDNPTSRQEYLFWDDASALHKQADGTEYRVARFDFNKTRRGEKGWVSVLWEGKYQRFTDVPDHLTIGQGTSDEDIAERIRRLNDDPF